MKTKLVAIALFALTVSAVVVYPMYRGHDANATVAVNVPEVVAATNNATGGDIPQQAHRVEVVFAIDTTGSMGGLIQAAKEKVWSIASTMASSQSGAEIKMGLIAYRDRGDSYVTRVFDLSGDLDSMYANLMDFQANGGGDAPESVNQALYEAINNISWSRQSDNVYQVVFLVGDAPPHMDYQDDVKYPQTLAQAKSRGIVINTIQCGNMPETGSNWRKIASLAGGDYFSVDQNGSAVAVTTPYDKKLAELSEKLDDTRLAYGDKAVKAKKEQKRAAVAKLHSFSSDASRARRAAFNVSKSGKSNLIGDNDLVEDVMSGKTELSKVEQAHLPNSMQGMNLAQQQRLLGNMSKQRKELKQQIQALVQKRTDFIQKKVKKAGGAKDSLDEKIYSAVKAQATKKGLRYDAENARY